MNVLAFDTSSAQGSVAVVKEGVLKAVNESDVTTRHIAKLLPLIDQTLNEAGISIRDIDLFVVTIGPGSFTGLRIALSAVSGLSFAEKKPIVGLSSLEAMACSCQGVKELACIYDALRGDVFYGMFNTEGDFPRRLKDDQKIGAAKLFHDWQQGTLIVGNGIKVIRGFLDQEKYSINEEIQKPNAADFIFFGIECYKKHQQLYDALTIRPSYLQESAAEEKLKERGAS